MSQDKWRPLSTAHKSIKKNFLVYAEDPDGLVDKHGKVIWRILGGCYDNQTRKVVCFGLDKYWQAVKWMPAPPPPKT